MTDLDASKTYVLVPFVYTEQMWAGGAVYLANLIRTLSSLSDAERPCLLLIHLLPGAIPDNLMALTREDAVGGVFSGKGVPLALKPWLRDVLFDPSTGAMREERRQRLFAMAAATFPVPFALWGVQGLPRPIHWIPDFQHKRLPEFFTREDIEGRDRLFGEIAAAPTPLLLSSQAALDDLKTFYPHHRCRPYVWSFCSVMDAADAAASGNPVIKYDLPARYLYLANQFWAHKDHRTAFKALKLLNDRGIVIDLVCSGAASDHRNPGYFGELKVFVDELGVSDRVRFVGMVPRQEQIGLFRHAAAVLQPSRFEGWSTVVEDARALGRPVVLSDIAVHREQMGEGGVFFQTGNAEDLARVLAELWHRLPSGPDPVAEARALTEGQERRRACARAFLAIVAAEKKPTVADIPAIPAEDTLARPVYKPMSKRVSATCYSAPTQGAEWYPPVMFGIDHFTDRLFTGGYVKMAVDLLDRLTPDAYTSYLGSFYRNGLERFGSGWRYADIVTVLLCLSDLLRPERYLEIGVRRGRSLCAVASRSPNCAVHAFDMWMQDYAGMENPGPDFVAGQLSKVGHQGQVQFVNGNSHETLPQFFSQNPDLSLDMITVDGDHSMEGAARDLADVLPHLSIGGAVVFDDICHPAHPELAEVWKLLVADDPRFSTWTYKDVGYGVGVAIRKY